MPLSDTWLKANVGKPREVTEVKTDRDGLSVRISPKGKIVYQLRYRYNGKAGRLDLGSYPNVSLKAARDECGRLKAKLEQGHDPKVVVAVEKQSIINADTLEQLYYRWHDNYCELSKRNPKEIKRSFEIHVFPKIGKLPADQITLHEWFDLLEPLTKYSPAIAERVLINAKQMYKWGVRWKLVENNPLEGLLAYSDLHIQKRTTNRVLSDAEIGLVWAGTELSRMSPKNKVFVKLCLIYGCRNGELRVAKKEDFDFDSGVWDIPAENHKVGIKTGKALNRPIIGAAEILIREAIKLSAAGPYLFNNEGTGEPMSRSVPLQLPYNIMQWVRRRRGVEMPHWSMHDLRRTARTNFSTLAPPHVAETMLGHKLPGDWQTYDLHDYINEQREAYEKWWGRLAGFISQ